MELLLQAALLWILFWALLTPNLPNRFIVVLAAVFTAGLSAADGYDTLSQLTSIALCLAVSGAMRDKPPSDGWVYYTDFVTVLISGVAAIGFIWL